MSNYVVKLSGGAQKGHFVHPETGETFKNKSHVENYIKKFDSTIRFVNSVTKETDYIVYPNEIRGPSPSSLKYATEAVSLSEFIDLIRPKKGGKKSSSKRYATEGKVKSKSVVIAEAEEEQNRVSVKSLMNSMKTLRVHQDKMSDEIDKVDHQLQQLMKHAA